MTGRSDKSIKDQVQQIQHDWPELDDTRGRRASVGFPSEYMRDLKEEESVDSSMGFRELERVESLSPQLMKAHC